MMKKDAATTKVKKISKPATRRKSKFRVGDGYKKMTAAHKATGKILSIVPVDAMEEHRIILPGIEMAINHTLKMGVMIDQTGSQDHKALEDLQMHFEKMGYFLHCVIVAPPTEKDTSE